MTGNSLDPGRLYARLQSQSFDGWIDQEIGAKDGVYMSDCRLLEYRLYVNGGLAARISLVILALVFYCPVSADLSEMGFDNRSTTAPERLSPSSVPAAGSSSGILKDVLMDSGSREEYRIRPDDLLTIEVFQIEELSAKQRVNSAGNVVLPLIGEVRLSGLSAVEAEAIVADKLRENFLQDPQVNIYIEEYASQRVTVTGSVKQPGVYPIKGPITLVQALALAQGLNPVANPEEILLFRTSEERKPIIYLINLKEIERGEKADPKVQADDRIVVPESGAKSVIKGITDTLRGFIRFW